MNQVRPLEITLHSFRITSLCIYITSSVYDNVSIIFVVFFPAGRISLIESLDFETGVTSYKFSFTVNDGKASAPKATLTVNVQPRNEPPEFAHHVYHVSREEGPVNKMQYHYLKSKNAFPFKHINLILRTLFNRLFLLYDSVFEIQKDTVIVYGETWTHSYTHKFL